MKKQGYSWEISGDMLKTDNFTLSMNKISSVESSIVWWGYIVAFISILSMGIFIYSLFHETMSIALMIALGVGSLLFVASQLIIIADGKKYKVNSRLSINGEHDIQNLKDNIEEYIKNKN